MGLDGVEWLMSVERAFGIAVSDEEAHALRTIGDTVWLLEQRLGARQGWCATQRTYHRLCRARGQRRLPLRAAIGAVPLALGSLEVPRETPRAVDAAMTLGVLGVAAAGWTMGPIPGVLATLGSAAAAGAVAERTARHDAQMTVAEAARTIAAANYGALLSEGAAWDRRLAARTVMLLAATQMGIGPDEIHLETRLAELFCD